MGDPKRARKKYETPRHPWQKARIEEEAALLKDYGLKNKRELWKHETELRNYRARARKIAGLRGEEAGQAKAELFAKLDRLGVMVKKEPSLDDVLGLTLRDFLERRLQTLVYRQSLAHTPRQARQFITHGHVALGDKKVAVPSLFVKKGLESTINYSSSSRISKTHISVPKVVVSPGESLAKEAAARAERATARTGRFNRRGPNAQRKFSPRGGPRASEAKPGARGGAER